MDTRLARARELHREAREAEKSAAQLREQRDRIILVSVRGGMSHARVAREIGCSPELVNKIVRLSRLSR
jgi:hypothetical protein